MPVVKFCFSRKLISAQINNIKEQFEVIKLHI
jgi:hypothetical protein